LIMFITGEYRGVPMQGTLLLGSHFENENTSACRWRIPLQESWSD